MELFPSRLAAAQAAGISKDTWKHIEEGDVVRDVSYAKVDRALGWATGSCVAIAEGGEPVRYIEAGGEPTEDVAIPATWAAEDVEQAITESAMATTPDLTVRQIRALSDETLKALRKRGILPKRD